MSKSAYEVALAQPNLAFVIGNGVNRLDSNNSAPSWELLIQKLAKKRKVKLPESFAVTMNLTEVADILRLQDETSKKLRDDVVELLAKQNFHQPAIAAFAHKNRIPILTTNFDLRLTDPITKSPNIKRFVKSGRRRTPKGVIPTGWNVFRGNPSQDTYARNIPGLWHMHGSVDIPSSIKLTSAQYARALSKASHLIQKQGLYANLKCNVATCTGCKECGWTGQSTWLDIFFHKNLLIVGFRFDRAEVFLRSMLVERTKYLKHRFGSLKKIPKSYFVTTGEPISEGERFFFESLGFEVLSFKDHSEPFSLKYFQTGAADG